MAPRVTPYRTISTRPDFGMRGRQTTRSTTAAKSKRRQAAADAPTSSITCLASAPPIWTETTAPTTNRGAGVLDRCRRRGKPATCDTLLIWQMERHEPGGAVADGLPVVDVEGEDGQRGWREVRHGFVGQ